MVLCSKSWKVLAKSMVFWTNYHVLLFRWTFQQKGSKSGSIRETARKIIDLAKTLQLFEQTTMSLHFDELFRKKLQKVPHFVRKHEKLSIWRKLATFRANYHVFFGIFMNFSAKSCKKCLIWWKSTRNHRFGKNYPTFWTNYHVFAFWWTFKEKVGKRGSFREKARKLVDLVKTCNFSRKLPCFDVSMHFSAKIPKTASFCEKARQLIDLAKTMQLFRTNYHVLVFRWTFQPKVAQSGSILEEARKFIDLAKTLQLFEQTTMSLHFDELFRRKLQKVPHFVKKHGKPSIWPKLATFGANYHVLAFSWTFQQGGAKSASFREKARETIDLANTMQLFEQTTMFLHFDELLRKRLEKVVHLVKKHEKSWIWSKLATFRRNCHVFVFRWTFKEKVGKSGSFREKARELMHFLKTCNFSKKLPCFDVSMNFSAKSCKKCLISWKNTKDHRFGQTMQLFRTNYHVLVFRWTFEQKVAKSCSIREKARKIIHLAKSLQFFELTTMSLHFDQLFRKKLQKVPHFVKQQEKSLIWPELCNFRNKLQCLFPFDELSEKSCKKCVVSWKSTKNHRFCQLATFRENYHVLTFRWTLQQKVAKSCSCREKARKIINLAKSLQLFEQTSMFLHFDEFSRKKLPKVLRFVKKHEKSSILSKTLQFFEQTTTFWHFDEVFSKKLQKVPHFVKKHEKSSIWPKLATFPTNYHVLTFGELFSEKLQKVPRFLRKL